MKNMKKSVYVKHVKEKKVGGGGIFNLLGTAITISELDIQLKAC